MKRLLLIPILTISCCKPKLEPLPPVPVIQPCPPIRIPPEPKLPILNYHSSWNKDQLLQAYTQSLPLAIGYYQALLVQIKAHNDREKK